MQVVIGKISSWMRVRVIAFKLYHRTHNWSLMSNVGHYMAMEGWKKCITYLHASITLALGVNQDLLRWWSLRLVNNTPTWIIKYWPTLEEQWRSRNFHWIYIWDGCVFKRFPCFQWWTAFGWNEDLSVSRNSSRLKLFKEIMFWAFHFFYLLF